jgi:hypothetical protein
MDSLSCTGSEDITVNYLTCDNKIVNTNLNVSGNTILYNLTISGLNVLTALNALYNVRSDNIYSIIAYDSSSNNTSIHATYANAEILFDTYFSTFLYNTLVTPNKYLTKIDTYGKLNVFHIQDILLPTRSQGWWIVHDELAQSQRDVIGLRFDLTNTMATLSLLGGTVTSQGISIGTLQSTLTSTIATLASTTGAH